VSLSSSMNGLVALADDGTAWVAESGKWKQLERLPDRAEAPAAAENRRRVGLWGFPAFAGPVRVQSTRRDMHADGEVADVREAGLLLRLPGSGPAIRRFYPWAQIAYVEVPAPEPRPPIPPPPQESAR
jgi:hypothetical protein